MINEIERKSLAPAVTLPTCQLSPIDDQAGSSNEGCVVRCQKKNRPANVLGGRETVQRDALNESLPCVFGITGIPNILLNQPCICRAGKHAIGPDSICSIVQRYAAHKGNESTLGRCVCGAIGIRDICMTG